jgi:hypothetical protein
MRTLKVIVSRATQARKLWIMVTAVALGAGLAAILPSGPAVATQSPPQTVRHAIGLDLYSPAWVDDGKIVGMKIVLRCTPETHGFINSVIGHVPGLILSGEVNQASTGAHASLVGTLSGCTPEGRAFDLTSNDQTGSFTDGEVGVQATVTFIGLNFEWSGSAQINGSLELQS